MSREEEIRARLFDHTLNGHAPEVKALTEEGLGGAAALEQAVKLIDKTLRKG